MASRQSGDVFFDVDARHIRQLGQELVGDRVTAVAELAKNSYDADATKVTITFSPSEADDRILIVDDGHGMTFDDLVRGWMRISTPDKDLNPLSPGYGRARAGRKGIGRFATETLGSRLELRTTVAGQATCLVVEFDWTAFPSGKNLETIPIPYRHEPAARDQHGTELVISGLHHEWTTASLDSIGNALLLLQPPFPVAATTSATTQDPGFRVEVERQDVTTTAQSFSAYEEFIEAATARVWIHADDRTATARVVAPLFDLDQTITLQPTTTTGPIEASAAYYVYRDEALGSIKVRTAQTMGRKYGGIRVYRDGLRVMPYGDPGVDWLSLDELQGSRSSTLAAIRNLNWFGQVLIGRESNPWLIDTASREGLVQNLAYGELTRLLRDAFVRSAELVASARGRKGRTDTPPNARTRREVLQDAERTLVERLDEQLPRDVAESVSRVVTTAFEDATKEAAQADATQAEIVRTYVGEIELLRILASLGTSIAVFNHEVQAVLDHAAAAHVALRADLDSLDLPPSTEEKVASAEASIERLTGLATYINSYVSVSQRRSRQEQPLYAIIEDFVEKLTGTLAKGATIEWDVAPPYLRTEPMTRSEIETILINFLTNAVKAMNQEGMPSRRIRITAGVSKRMALIRFQDTGIGVDPSIEERIFEPFVSDSRSPVTALGIGTGLGLKIVRDIAVSYGGYARLGEPDQGYATCMEFAVPYWKKQDFE